MDTYRNLTYNLFMFPFERTVLHGFRKSAVARASGDVLEVGVGTGVNSRYLDRRKIRTLTVLDTFIRESVMKKLKKHFDKFTFSEGSVERMPFDNGSFDTVVFTLVFCSVDYPEKGLAEVRRVLKDSGKLIFIEHVRPSGHRIGRIADKFNPAWNSFSNGCNLNRETLASIKEAGFSIEEGSLKRKGVFIKGMATKA